MIAGWFDETECDFPGQRKSSQTPLRQLPLQELSNLLVLLPFFFSLWRIRFQGLNPYHSTRVKGSVNHFYNFYNRSLQQNKSGKGLKEEGTITFFSLITSYFTKGPIEKRSQKKIDKGQWTTIIIKQLFRLLRTAWLLSRVRFQCWSLPAPIFKNKFSKSEEAGYNPPRCKEVIYGTNPLVQSLR
jgi:hypothetical protein